MSSVNVNTKAYLVGGGIASLAAAAYLVRAGRFPSTNIYLLEEAKLGGSLDAVGSPERGFSMRGSRMFGVAYVLMYELLSAIPSLDDPEKSVTQDLIEFSQASPWNAQARLVENGQIIDATSFGLSNKDRVDLIGLMLRDEEGLGAKQIDQYFAPQFFETNFWFMWASMFGFEPWHGIVELRRYLLRFLRLIPDLPNLKFIHSTRYNSFDSIVRPLVRWLEEKGVRFNTGVQVADLDFTQVNGLKVVKRICCLQQNQSNDIEVGENDIVFLTLGSMTADSTRGSMTLPPPLQTEHIGGAWTLWKRLAEKDSVFGRPAIFCGNVDRTKWVTFTVTHATDRFFDQMTRFSGSSPGCGGLVTLKSSSWLLTFYLYHTPAFAEQPPGLFVWWGYGLYPDRVGNYVNKRMSECSGQEILVELFSHLGWQQDIPSLLEGTQCIPCMLPYTTSQFMPRSKGDRPQVIPQGIANLACLGQYCEIPDNTVYTIEYSIHSAALAVGSFLGLPQMVPPAYHGLDHPNALAGAMKRILE